MILARWPHHLFQTCSRNSEVHSVHWHRPAEFHAGLNGFTSMSNSIEALMTGCILIDSEKELLVMIARSDIR